MQQVYKKIFKVATSTNDAETNVQMCDGDLFTKPTVKTKEVKNMASKLIIPTTPRQIGVNKIPEEISVHQRFIEMNPFDVSDK